MSTIPSYDTTEHTEAILDLLRSQLNHPVGDAQAPVTEGERTARDFPYCVVYEYDVFDFNMSGPFLTDSQGDKHLMYEIVSVGLNARQCREMKKAVRDVMLAMELYVPGFVIQDVQLDLMGRTLRDTDIRPPVFVSTDRYRIMSTPSKAL